MSIVASIGIDVSKDMLDISLDGARPFRIANDPASCAQLAERLTRPCTVHLEASGGHERLVRRALEAAGIPVRTLDPLKARRLWQSQARHAKTDSIDAKCLAKTGPLLPAKAPKSLQREALCDHSRAIEALKTSASEFLVRAGAAQLDPEAKAAYLEAADGLKAQAQKLEKRFLQRIKKSTDQQRFNLAKSVPGAGDRLARVCACELPEDLSPYSSAQICSYAGLAPIDASSGKRTGKARLGRGNSRLKAALYMPAVSAIRHQTWAKELYARLRAKGRLHQQAIVAVMRRLLVRVAAVLKRGSPWKDEPITA